MTKRTTKEIQSFLDNTIAKMSDKEAFKLGEYATYRHHDPWSHLGVDVYVEPAFRIEIHAALCNTCFQIMVYKHNHWVEEHYVSWYAVLMAIKPRYQSQIRSVDKLFRKR